MLGRGIQTRDAAAAKPRVGRRVSLRARVLLITIAAMLCVGGALLLIQRVVIESAYRTLEVADSMERTEQVRSLIDRELEAMDLVVLDWSAWDETYEYAQGDNPDYEADNLALNTLAAIELDLILIAGPDGTLLSSRALDRATATERTLLELDTEPALTAGNPLYVALPPSTESEPFQPVAGIVQLENGPLLVVSRPILRTDGEGPALGALLMGRMLDESVVDSIAQRLGVPIALLPPDAATLAGSLSAEDPIRTATANPEVIEGYALLSDLEGSPVAVVQVTLPRPIARAAYEVFRVLSGAVFVAMLVLGGALLWSMDRAVVAPLRALSTSVSHIAKARDPAQRVELADGGEIAAVAEDVNVMLGALELAGAERLRQEERFRAILANSSDAIAIVATDLKVLYVTPSATAVWGQPDAGMIGQSLSDLVHPDDRGALLAAIRDTAERATRVQLRLETSNASARWVEAVVGGGGAELLGGAVISARDVTERIGLHAELERLAFRDELTGLPNRAALTAYLGDVGASESVVLFADIDNFKLVNDTLGHGAGDALLATFAQRLALAVRPNDFVARFGGDEFVLVLNGVTAEQAQARAGQIVAQVSSPFQFAGRDVKVSVSVGAALLDHTLPDGEELLRRADIALYRAKVETRGHVVLFDADLDKAAQEVRQLQLQLPGATIRGEMRLFFQPMIDLHSGSIVGVEALVRWASPTHGLVMPAQFIDSAIESGEIVEIGRWMLVEACRSVQQWRVADRTARDLQLSVNISARELSEPGLRSQVAQALEGTGFPARLLQLEITEDAYLGDMAAAVTRFEELRALGVRLALDDFGTGYSSLSYLQQLPLDTLKLDRAFLANLIDDARPRAVVASVVQLATSLGMDVCAEGVETQAQASMLRTLGVATGQGYHFASPAPAGRLESMLEHAPLSAA